MSDLLPTESPTNAAEYTVSEISMALKRTVEDVFGNVRLRGEVSGYRGPHASGHCYFSLKDDRARIEAVIWKGTFSRLRFRPEEGMEVIAQGKLTTYPGSSKYQIVIESLEPAGAGALMAMIEERKRRLAAEGLFDAERKRRLPYLPRVIGVVTSPTGAVIRDIIHRITDRFPLHLVIWPVRVQGETTGAEVSAAVAGFNALGAGDPVPRPDIIIVARGGGSLEDLWGFNDEAVVRAVAASAIPVISAVGHETDWTLIDLAADIRAPTPTGAAELAVPVRAELEARLATLGARLSGCVSRDNDKRRQALRAAARALPSPDQLFALPRRRLDEAAGRLDRASRQAMQRRRAALDGLRLSPAVLSARIAAARRQLDRDAARTIAALGALAARRRSEFAGPARQLSRCADAYRQRRNEEVMRLGRRLSIAPIRRAVNDGRARLALAERRLDAAAETALQRAAAELQQAHRMLGALSHQSVLERGFALVEDAKGTLVKRAGEIAAGQALTLRFADGKAAAVATGSTGPRPGPKRQPADPDRQGRLL